MLSGRLRLLSCFVVLVYLFLYLPIVVLVLFSFNDNPFTQHWVGFTLDWYRELSGSTEIWQALSNSLQVAFSAVILSLTLGSLFIFFCNSRYVNPLMFLFYAALAIPEIVIAVALLSFFSFINISLSLTTLIAGHTILGLGYVVPILHTRYQELDVRFIEAAKDLGATQVQIFFTIVLPLLAPALLSAGLLAFIISLDDFLISFFCVSGSVQTLPLYIFSMIRAGATPVINALSTILLIVSGICVALFSLLQKNNGRRF
jgi:spermidine/putrescine transport system permease protein